MSHVTQVEGNTTPRLADSSRNGDSRWLTLRFAGSAPASHRTHHPARLLGAIPPVTPELRRAGSCDPAQFV